MQTRLPAPRPDFHNLRRALLRQGVPDRLPLVELECDHEMKEAFLGERMPRYPRKGTAEFTKENRARYLEFSIRFWYQAGYDFVPLEPDVLIIPPRHAAADTAALKHPSRDWVDENVGPISSWDDFERYRWPTPEDIDYFNVEWASRNLPEGMQIIIHGPGGHFETLCQLMGFTTLALAIFDTPDLVEAVSRNIGEVFRTLYATSAEIPNVGAFFLGDDMGYKTSTMVSPQQLRSYAFPYQKRIADIAHAHDMPFVLHSCGNLSRIMDELIDEVGIDAKHSFEDVIMPVAEAKRRWGDRIAILGGVDLDYLCRHSEDEVRAYTRAIIEDCAPGGGYALGTGNTVANYIPLANYLAMLEEGARYR